MQEPSYHLEGIIHSQDEMEDFSGPLEVILMLLAKNKVEIRDIQISLLLDQYLEYLHTMEEMDLEIASEFVQMASHLMYIKTKMLLTEEKEPTELELLVSALEQMQHKEAITAVRGIVDQIGEMSQEGLRMQSRGPLPREGKAYDYHHTADELIAALTDVLIRGAGSKEAEEFTSLKKAVPKPLIYNVRTKSEEIIRLLKEKRALGLRHLFGMCHSKSEIVATFLSILELCSDGHITIAGQTGEYVVSGCETDGTAETEKDSV